MQKIVIDTDSHIMEPKNLWQSYLSRSQSDVTLSIRDAPKSSTTREASSAAIYCGDQVLFPVCGSTPIGVDAFDASLINRENRPENYAARERLLELRRELFGYEGETPLSGTEPSHRLRWMDEQRITRSFILPTWGSMWERYLHSRPEAIAANMGAYNRWILDFCSADRSRLLPVCQISPNAMDWSLRELEFLAKNNVRAVLMRPVLYDGLTLSNQRFDPLWTKLTEFGIAVYFHVSGMGRGNEDFFEPGWFGSEDRGQHNGMIWGASVHVPMMLTLTAMLRDGFFDRFPRARLISAEHGFRWVRPWLEDFDERWKISVARGLVGHASRYPTPSDAILSNVWFAGAHGGELSALSIGGREAKVMFASDFPHLECSEQPVSDFLQGARGVSAETLERILHTNCEDLLGQQFAA